MGDTGSLALGGLIGMIAFMVHQPLTLIIVGGIFVMEASSVILQVGSFKLRGGKRIFRMSPVHHHFGWIGNSETSLEQTSKSRLLNFDFAMWYLFGGP